MNNKTKLALALQHIGQLLEFCDINGYGQDSQVVKAAREYWSNTIQEMQR